MSKRAVVIYNPAARRSPPIEAVRAAAQGLPDWNVTITSTEHAGQATALAKAAADGGADVVMACGGDGTVNEVVNGLAGSRTALAVLPGGTANVWAKEARIPRQPVDAMRLMAGGDMRTVDLGVAGERRFLLMAGVGFDAAVVRDAGGPWKKRIGAASYVLAGLRRAVGHRSVPGRLLVDGDSPSDSLYWLLVGNSRSYGGVVNITNKAQLDDGVLDVCLLPRGGLHKLAWLLPWLLLGRHDGKGGLAYRHAREIEITASGMPVQVDGEYIGETPIRIGILPGALRVIVPAGLKSPLFGRAPA
jgi:YegS/Rv2252/BmrU family lipid kinase